MRDVELLVTRQTKQYINGALEALQVDNKRCARLLRRRLEGLTFLESFGIGGIDRVVRVVAGIAIIVAGVVYQSWWGVIGIVPLGTAVFSWCPPYALLGISTCCAIST